MKQVVKEWKGQGDGGMRSLFREKSQKSSKWGCPQSQAVAGGRRRSQALEMPFFGQKPPFEGSMQ